MFKRRSEQISSVFNPKPTKRMERDDALLEQLSKWIGEVCEDLLKAQNVAVSSI